MIKKVVQQGRERRLACPILKGGPFVFNIPIIDIGLVGQSQ
jgi:hypothetical protein